MLGGIVLKRPALHRDQHAWTDRSPVTAFHYVGG